MSTTFTGRGLAALAAGAVLLLTACSAPAVPDDGDGAGDADASAARFVACLEDEGQTAKILDTGLVGLLLPESGSPGEGPTTSSGGGQGGLTSVYADQDGTWQASDSAAGYPEEGGMRDAWAACEERVPGFEQPEPDLSGADTHQVTADELQEASLAFAECARANGFADFADPDENGTLSLPSGITEDGLRSLLEACGSEVEEVGLPIPPEELDALDFDAHAVIGEFFGPTTSVGGR